MPATDPIEHFREFCRRYSRAVRTYDNARSTEGSMDRREAALSMKQALESEFQKSFRLMQAPNWKAVEDAAAGVVT